MGMFSTCQYLGLAIGSSGAGLIYHHAGLVGVSACCACLLMAWLLWTLRPMRYLVPIQETLTQEQQQTLLKAPGVLGILPSGQRDVLTLHINPRHFHHSAISEHLA